MKTVKFLIVMAVALVVASCADRPTDSQLDHQWQLLTISQPDGQTIEPDPRTYYCFFRDVAEIHQPGHDSLFGNLTYQKGSTLTIQFPDNTAAQLRAMTLPVDTAVADTDTGLTIIFAVREITSSRLILTTADGLTYTFRRY